MTIKMQSRTPQHRHGTNALARDGALGGNSQHDGKPDRFNLTYKISTALQE